jgi:thermitase
MKLRFVLAASAAVAVGVLVCAAPALAARPTILVKFERPSTGAAKVAAAGDTLLSQTPTRVAVVQVGPGETLAQKLAAYRARGDVVYAEQNHVLHALDLADPNDPDFGSQWGLAKIAAVAAWNLFPGSYAPASPGVRVAVVDDGIDSSHSDLSARVDTTLGADCRDERIGCVADPAVDTVNGHGTHVAGILGAATDNGVGVAGTAFDAQLVPVKVLDASGYGSYAAITNGIVWAVQHGAKVINLSLGGPDPSETLCGAVRTAEGAPYFTLVVAAAGNRSSGAPPFESYPAACPGAIGVAATDQTDAPALFSNEGYPSVFVAAPGAAVYSTLPGDSYGSLSGTSMATPFVTGLAALLFSKNPTWSLPEVVRTIAGSADQVVTGAPYGTDPFRTCLGCTWSSTLGYGRIDALRALNTLVPPAPVPPPAPPPPAPPPPPPPGSPPPLPDRRAPVVTVYRTTAKHGSRVKLRYRVQDDSGETSEQIRVYRRTRLLKGFARTLRPTDAFTAYWVLWRAPSSAQSLRYCVLATDEAGNRSALTCARLLIR